MSGALQRLDEIEARLKAATPGPWCQTEPGNVCSQSVVACDSECPASTHCHVCIGTYSPDDQPLIAHAPADLALLARLVRRIAEASCDLPARRSGGCMDVEVDERCWPCRIRGELGGAR